LPANSNTSAVRYSRMAALYTAAVAPTLPKWVVRVFKCHNCWWWCHSSHSQIPYWQEADENWIGTKWIDGHLLASTTIQFYPFSYDVNLRILFFMCKLLVQNFQARMHGQLATVTGGNSLPLQCRWPK
jgi:hypothetical protein